MALKIRKYIYTYVIYLYIFFLHPSIERKFNIFPLVFPLFDIVLFFLAVSDFYKKIMKIIIILHFQGRCARENCKYLHPPPHLKTQLEVNGRNNLIQQKTAAAMFAQQMQFMLQNAQMSSFVSHSIVLKNCLCVPFFFKEYIFIGITLQSIWEISYRRIQDTR